MWYELNVYGSSTCTSAVSYSFHCLQPNYQVRVGLYLKRTSLRGGGGLCAPRERNMCLACETHFIRRGWGALCPSRTKRVLGLCLKRISLEGGRGCVPACMCLLLDVSVVVGPRYTSNVKEHTSVFSLYMVGLIDCCLELFLIFVFCCVITPIEGRNRSSMSALHKKGILQQNRCSMRAICQDSQGVMGNSARAGNRCECCFRRHPFVCS